MDIYDSHVIIRQKYFIASILNHNKYPVLYSELDSKPTCDCLSKVDSAVTVKTVSIRWYSFINLGGFVFNVRQCSFKTPDSLPVSMGV